MREIDATLAAGLARRFRIIRQLGAGGMGTVYLAEQIGVGRRPVALKVLLRKLGDDPDFLQRFQDEAASTGRIRHPNVVTIYESGQSDDGTPYIAMEYLDGEPLGQTLKRRGALPVAEVAEILCQVASGLHAAHKLGIIHRDLKPDNIFLTYSDAESAAPASPPARVVGAPDPGAQVGTGTTRRAQGMPWHAPTGREAAGAVAPVSPPAAGTAPAAPATPPANLAVKIVDFGIAKLRESATHTLTGMVLGTPAYMSYEQASGMKSDELDARSDVYSLGVVAYEMLTGHLPFESDTPVGYLRKHLQDTPPPFRTANPDLSALPEVESVVVKALEKDREQRYGSALEFASAFAQAAVPAPRVMPPAPPALPPQPAARPQPKRRLRIASLAAFVVLVTVAALVWLYRPRPQPKPAQTAQQSLLQQEWERATPIWPKPSDAAQVSLQGTRTVWENSKDGLKYVWIPPGTFMMGCSPGDNECSDFEKPSHQVTITRGFWIGQTPVTVGAYKRFIGATGQQMPDALNDLTQIYKANKQQSRRDEIYQELERIANTDDNMPIVNVTWDDAHAYCEWTGGRLATEAEWEYAARGGSTEPRYGPIDDVAWYKDNSRDRMHDVGQKRANGFGLYDMLGNVEEWVNDWSDQKYYQGSPSQDPQGPGNGQYRVLRGGSWTDRSSDVRVSKRSRGRSNLQAPDVGFRCGGEAGNP